MKNMWYLLAGFYRYQSSLQTNLWLVAIYLSTITKYWKVRGYSALLKYVISYNENEILNPCFFAEALTFALYFLFFHVLLTFITVLLTLKFHCGVLSAVKPKSSDEKMKISYWRIQGSLLG